MSTQAKTTVANPPLAMDRLLRAYLMEARYETLAALRTTGFALPFVAVPVAIYLFVGVLLAGNGGGAHGPAIANYLFAGFSVLAAAMPGIFTGVILATEREGRLLTLRRALPQPPGATIVAKVVMSMAVAAIAVSLVTAAALVGGRLTIGLTQVATMWAVAVVGSIPFCAIGLLIGALASASSAPAWGNLLFLPMTVLSGLFIQLPKGLEPWVVVWPTFHLAQLALGLAGVEPFVYVPRHSPRRCSPASRCCAADWRCTAWRVSDDGASWQRRCADRAVDCVAAATSRSLTLSIG